MTTLITSGSVPSGTREIQGILNRNIHVQVTIGMDGTNTIMRLNGNLMISVVTILRLRQKREQRARYWYGTHPGFSEHNKPGIASRSPEMQLSSHSKCRLLLSTRTMPLMVS